MACLYKDWWVSLTASVLSKGKGYFRNVLASCQHSWSACVLATAYYIPQEW